MFLCLSSVDWEVCAGRDYALFSVSPRAWLAASAQHMLVEQMKGSEQTCRAAEGVVRKWQGESMLRRPSK